ncbi:MAG: Asp-tRNA(Asn)/Glu-tRNA(Gln) amidotransferase subunit GatA [Candidatus Peribacteraceae bacterium]|nr:Asp-tRNA(Asn)/Glu-tRNA(Gln) amidotransferase subunit GatA [Candidatus Peribacteraceae bacterium]
MDLTSLNLVETKKLLADKKASESEIVADYMQRIADLDPKIDSFLFVAQDTKSENPSGELGGIPIAHKDVFDTIGMPTTAASKILEGYTPEFDATSVAKLKEAGAVSLGKLNTDEFTMGASTETSAFKQTKNPWDLKRVPGGSSGGSAAAVAADLCVFATATDTGGSIRQPSSFCGVTGLKPTYGRISRYGVISMASSLDTIGVITKSVEDAAIALEVLAGQDSHDATTGKAKVEQYSKNLKTDLKGLKIGVAKEYFVEGLDAGVEKVIRAAIDELKKLGAEITEISLPHTEFAVPTYYVVASSEISANMARFDGVRYGPTVKNEEVENLVEMYFENRTRGFGDEVKRRIMLGTFALSAGYADKFYKKALQVRTLIKKDFDEAFKDIDLIAAPVAPTTAFKLGEKINDPVQMYLADIFTAPASLAGVPAISVPAGFSEKLPVGLQLIAPQFAEARLLGSAHAFQSATDYHLKKPQI